jgi:hypothetical protein
VKRVLAESSALGVKISSVPLKYPREAFAVENSHAVEVIAGGIGKTGAPRGQRVLGGVLAKYASKCLSGLGTIKTASQSGSDFADHGCYRLR